jgi:hypothetical protein
MGHDPDKFLMGTVDQSGKLVSSESGDPATFAAGLAVRLANTGALSLSSGSLIGVSAGPDLADTKKTAVIRTGSGVPIQLTDEGVQASLEKEELTFTAVAIGTLGNELEIEFLDTANAGEEVATVTEGGRISLAMDSTTSTATQCKAALDDSAEVLALITTEITGTAGSAMTAFSVDELEGGVDAYEYVEVGAVVEVDASTGKAVSSDAATGAIYLTAPKTGVNMDGTTVDVALIEMGGGL